MRRVLLTTLLATALATPALALTVSPAPNRDQAAHLKQGTTSGGGVDLRDTLAGGGRPFTGGGFSDGTYRQTQTFGFGAVTTTITRGSDLGPSFLDRTFLDPPRQRILVTPELVGRRR